MNNQKGATGFKPNYLTVIIPVLLALVISGVFFAQTDEAHSQLEGELIFFMAEHDFGKITEGTVAEHRFEFMNGGNEPVKITQVRTSCGCTTPEYSKDEIQPDSSGYLIVRYDSDGRPGAFNKKIFVSHTGQSSLSKLTIKGFVEAKLIDGKDVTEIGNLRFSQGRIDLVNAPRDQFHRINVKAQNIGEGPVKIEDVEKPEDVWVNYPSFTIFKGETIHINMVFQPAVDRADKGVIPVKLQTTDRKEPVKTINIHYNFVRDKSAVEKGAIIEFDSTVVRMGSVIQGEKPIITYRFKNTGNETLKFESIRPSCGCTVADLDKRIFEPGEEGELKIELDTFGKIGEMRKEIDITTNDAVNPELKLVLWADIIEHPDPEQMMSMRKMSSGNIFEGDCRSCHVNRGMGKLGAALYEADCQMCHGPVGGDNKHHPGTQFTNEYLTAVGENYLEQIIAEGTPDEAKKHMMPGFHTSEGGPLSDDQIASLVNYLKSKESLQK